MDDLIESIKTAIANDANDEARAKGAVACRTILSTLQTQAGEPMAPAAPMPEAPTATQIASIVGALRQLPPDQLLDLAIARLRAALPSAAEAPTTAPTPVRFQIVQVPPFRGKS